MATIEKPQAPKGPPAGPGDERVRSVGFLGKLLRRPELGAVIGAVVVWVFFAVVAGDSGFLSRAGAANYLVVSAELGILAVVVALLMIGGEFDLSVGSMIGASGMIVALATAEYGLPLWLTLILAFGFALAIGALNGFVVVKTKLPSFIVTLASLFILRGLTLGMTRLLTGRTQIGGVQNAVAGNPLAELFVVRIGGFPVVIVWWLALVALAAWVLRRTRFGNWIVGAGGDPVAARNSGVPVARVKILLFMSTAAAAALVGVITTIQAGSADTLRGELKEFEAIIAAVIGGTLLTGGYGSALGALFGALTFGIVRQGIFFTGANTDWFRVFLGAMLLIAVLANNYIRNKALASR
ncbi:MAG: ABC transporter permease [Egibacteraceae bacterium]